MSKIVNKSKIVDTNEMKCTKQTIYMIRNIKIDYVYNGLLNFSITNAIWVLYLGAQGMSMWQIGLVEGIFHLTGILFEVPTGAMGDLLGRKKTMLLGRVAGIASAFFMMSSYGFWGFALSFFFSAVSYNLNSGSEEALVYDSLKAVGAEEKFLKINGRRNFAIEVFQGMGTFVGGVLAEFSYYYVYVSDIIKEIATIIVGTQFKEPDILCRENDSGEKKMSEKGISKESSILKHFQLSIEVLKGNKQVRNILLYFPVVFAFYTVIFFYGQQHLANLGFSKIYIAIVMLVAGVFSAIGALTSEKVSAILKEKTKLIGAFFMAITIFLFGRSNVVIIIPAFFTLNYFNGMMYPTASYALNRLIPSEQRATILSVDSMIFSIIMILIFPISGAICEYISIGNVFQLLGIILVCFIVGFYKIEQRSSR